MKTDKIVQSKIYRFLDYVFRIVILNMLIVVPSFFFFVIASMTLDESSSLYNILSKLPMIPFILWFFPSIVAVIDVIKQYECNETNTIWKDFFQSFKKNYFKSIILFIIILIGAYLLINSLVYFYTNLSKGTIQIIGLAFSFSFMVAFLMIVLQIPLVMAYFKNLRLIEIVKLASILAFKDVLSNILIVIIFTVMIFLSIAVYIIMGIIGLSLPCYLAIKLSNRTYMKIYRKVEKND